MPQIRYIAACALAALAAAASAERLHHVIPAGPGGGLDGTARESGRVLKTLNAFETVSFENLPGGGGGRAMSQFIENTSRYRTAILVNSTPLIVRSLQGLFPHSFRDLTPVAGLVADYGIFVVRADDPIATWSDLEAALRANPREIIVGGGSVRGSLDHIVLALALKSMAVEPRSVRYLPYDGGGKAMLALLGNEVRVLSSGVGETVSFLQSGKVRALAVTAPSRIDAIGDVPTLEELDHEVVFANWRGVFAQRGVDAQTRANLITQYTKLRASPQWRDVLDKRGWQSLDVSGAEFSRYLESQEESLVPVLRDLGFIR